MEPENLFSGKNLTPENFNTGKALNGYHSSPETTGSLDKTSNGNYYVRRLQKLQKRNAALEKIASQQKTEMDEITALNKKYISILAHDLKSPFSSIYGVLGILKELIHENKFEEINEYIDLASSSAINTSNLIENHLAWVKAQNNETIFNPVVINLNRLINMEIENCHLSVKLKNISLSHSIPPSLNAMADLQMMKTIMRNLINNAIKFTPSGGNITISARIVESLIEITVKDDGRGISQTDQQELFMKGPLKTVSVTNSGRGKGLGLLLCKEFLETHGCEIHVESELGEGSSFIFTLPMHTK